MKIYLSKISEYKYNRLSKFQDELILRVLRDKPSITDVDMYIFRLSSWVARLNKKLEI